MILGSFSADGWCCVPVLLVVWHGVSSTVACWSLSGAGSSCLDGDLWESFSHLILHGAGRSLVEECPELGFPPQRHRTDTRLEHQDPVSYTEEEKKEKYIYIVAPKVHRLNFGMTRCLFRYSRDAPYIKLIVEI